MREGMKKRYNVSMTFEYPAELTLEGFQNFLEHGLANITISQYEGSDIEEKQGE